MKIKPPASSNSPTSRKKPRIMRHLIPAGPKPQSAISGGPREIQPHQHLICTFKIGSPRSWPALGARKALTLQAVPSIRTAMAAGAIPPPLFFERRRHEGIFAPAHGIVRDARETPYTRETHQS